MEHFNYGTIFRSPEEDLMLCNCFKCCNFLFVGDL